MLAFSQIFIDSRVMLFCDLIYFALLLPITVFLYWKVIACRRFSLAISILIIASAVFYITWSWKFFLLLLGSATTNFFIGRKLLSTERNPFILLLGVLFNVSLLGYFKYFNFFIDNCNWLLGTHFQFAKIVLPLGISFYTFQQIAYIVDAYKHEIQPCGFFTYILFVIYFPQLVAGPIVHYQEMMPQFGAQKEVRWDLIWEGLFIFICGLFKKIIIADKLAVFVQQGYGNVDQIGFLGAWLLSLSYTFQLYFDFSGYADMAIGSGLFFGIRLPENFNSPYKALDIQDFWRRWHITLSTWLKNYIYIPLGGSHCTLLRTCINLFLTFFIGGIWHGAGWTFIICGTMHGIATVIHRLWHQTGLHLNKFFAWLITFNFVNFALIFFRAESVGDAEKMVKTMFNISWLKEICNGWHALTHAALLRGTLFSSSQLHYNLKYCLVCLFICLFLKNIRDQFSRFCKPSIIKIFFLIAVFWGTIAAIVSRICENADRIDFLYWQF